jgi:hypothetical protein
VPKILELIVKLLSNYTLSEAPQSTDHIVRWVSQRKQLCSIQKLATKIRVWRVEPIELVQRSQPSSPLMRLPIEDLSASINLESRLRNKTEKIELSCWILVLGSPSVADAGFRRPDGKTG